MRNRSRFSLALLLITISISSFAGCGTSEPTRFYMLQPMVEPGASIQQTIQGEEFTVGIGPVKFPEYLHRPQIVTRSGQSKFEIAEIDRWAEPLQDNFARVLAQNLSALLSTNRVVTYPWDRSASVKYQVIVDVLSFFGDSNQRAVLEARWSVVKPSGGKNGSKTIATKRSVFDKPIQAAGFENLVQTESQLLESFCAEIAEAIKMDF